MLIAQKFEKAFEQFLKPNKKIKFDLSLFDKALLKRVIQGSAKYEQDKWDFNKNIHEKIYFFSDESYLRILTEKIIDEKNNKKFLNIGMIAHKHFTPITIEYELNKQYMNKRTDEITAGKILHPLHISHVINKLNQI